MSAYEDLAQRWAAVMMPNYGVPAVALARGEGARVWDVDGVEYLDLFAGIAVSSLGHGHPAVVEAVTRQVASAGTHEQPLRARARRTPGRATAPPGRRGRSGLLLPGRRRGQRVRPEVGPDPRASPGPVRWSAARRGGGGGFPRPDPRLAVHHRHAGQASALRAVAGPGDFVPYGDIDALEATVDDTVSAVFLETTLGEGGVVPAPEGYLAAARAACDRAGALLVVDEVQSGIGRTGHWLASIAQGVLPDVITVAKGLAGGLPLGACIGIGDSGRLFSPGDHGSTFGGNPVSCAAALAVIDTIDAEDLLTHVKRVGERWATGFGTIQHPLLAGHRGGGLWWALELTSARAGAVEAAARTAGFLVNAVQPDAVRLAPPLILTEEQADSFTAALPSILAEAAR